MTTPGHKAQAASTTANHAVATGIHDDVQQMSIPVMSGFVPGPVNHAAASAAFAHHAEDARPYHETTPIKLSKPEPNMTPAPPAPKRYDYSQDKSGPQAPPPESVRRLDDMLHDEGPNMSEAPPAPAPKNLPRAVCDRDVSCAPVSPSLGEQVKTGLGKVWVGISKAIGGNSEQTELDRGPANPPGGGTRG